MSNASVPQGTHQPRRRTAVIAVLVVLSGGGGWWGLSTRGGGEHTQGPQVTVGCAAVFSIGSCTSSSLPPRTEPGTDGGKRQLTPQLIPAQEGRGYVLDWRDGPAFVRSTPSVNGHFLYTLDPHHHPTQIKIICQTWADVVQPAKGPPTRLWDRIAPDEWISDAYLDTGSARPVTKMCDQPQRGPDNRCGHHDAGLSTTLPAPATSRRQDQTGGAPERAPADNGGPCRIDGQG
ncbi:hypothetical protein [Streptomyces decoyicus]|uniref:hypothetical protein n=1 Tax=Streptomyces decoyicus TaxID=249567 RepID=UPI003662693B